MSARVMKQVSLRRRVYQLFGQMSKLDIVKHFQMEGIPRSTIYSIIKRCETGLPVEDKVREGRPPKLNKNDQDKLKKMVENKVGVSQRQLAAHFSVSRYCIMRNMKKLGLRYYKRQRAPKYNLQQLEKIPGQCRKLRRKFIDSKTIIILDDEKYFSLSGDNMPANAGFYSRDRLNTPNDVKFKQKQKFEPKVLVWLALSNKGFSQPYIGRTKGVAINSHVYIRRCLPKLLTFIKAHHQHDKYIFWPDLASSHYANTTIDWLKKNNINFVPRSVNPPNIPKARPIEDFWSILAQKVYSGGWTATTQQQLISRIKRQLKKIDLNVVQKTMLGVRKKLRKIEEQGPFSIL